MSATLSREALEKRSNYVGNDQLLFGMILGVLAFWLFAQTTLNIAPTMAAELTIGYAIAIVAFIRVGEKLLQRFGPRRPMVWGSLIVGLSIVLLMPTSVMLGTYRVLAVVSFTLFGLGLAFYATPSTDAALANLPANQAGAGSGLYKMASSLGAAFGVAISASLFTALSADSGPVDWIPGAITFVGRQDNVAMRQAALVAFAANLLMVVAAIVSILLTVPKASPRTNRS